MNFNVKVTSWDPRCQRFGIPEPEGPSCHPPSQVDAPRSIFPAGCQNQKSVATANKEHCTQGSSLAGEPTPDPAGRVIGAGHKPANILPYLSAVKHLVVHPCLQHFPAKSTALHLKLFWAARSIRTIMSTLQRQSCKTVEVRHVICCIHVPGQGMSKGENWIVLCSLHLNGLDIEISRPATPENRDMTGIFWS